jgi:hypothetical protein
MKCENCNKKKATITFCKSFLEYSHGFAKRLCEDCYRKILEDTIKSCRKTLKELDTKQKKNI